MNKKVLVLDDEQGIRESLKLILNDDYELILTSTSEAASDVLKNDPSIGVMLLDIKMPQVNGLDFLEVVKKDYPQLPVVIVTGYKSVDTASEATSRGANGYIVKPFNSKDILEVVGKHIT